MRISRRGLLGGAGALIVGFSMRARSSVPAAPGVGGPDGGALPASLARYPWLDSWIRITADGSVTAFTGKAELGQGIKTALLQLVAEELEVSFERLQLVTADTARTPDEMYTAGSRSMQDSGTALRYVASQVLEILKSEAARRWGVPADRLSAANGAIIAPDGKRIAYGELVADELLYAQVRPPARLKDPARFKVVNRSVPRIDIPAKVSGGEAFVQDLRLPGMLHGRVLRPPSYGAQLKSLDLAPIERMPGVVKGVRDGNFVGVVAEGEFQAIKAMRAMADRAHWKEKPGLPRQQDLAKFLTALPAEDFRILDRHAPHDAGLRRVEARYSRPYLSHGSIGPSCAVALFCDGVLTVWTHSQGVYPLRKAIAEMLDLPAGSVRCIHTEGSGCYGHNGADDAAADAAMLAMSLPGTPIRLQWMREQESTWEPFGPAMVASAAASLDASGRVVTWDYGVWSNTHTMRPGPAGALLAAQEKSRPFPVPHPFPLPQPEGGGDRNGIPLYSFPAARVVNHFLVDMPIRVSSLRSLGAHMNVFAIESFMDELALAARADPVEFRLRHLTDPRAREVVTKAAEQFGWGSRKAYRPGSGFGFAFARYKNLGAYCAVALAATVEGDSGRIRVSRVVAAVDAGEIVNPDGVKNQVEGAILQSLSWALYESVRFDDTRITS
ncbi:MAG: molybdopterin cofactor-binding domain-containing protein, partial [Steroidobacteraceae bacterium]